jgi:hypothetical protein
MTCTNFRCLLLPTALCPPLFQTRRPSAPRPFFPADAARQGRSLHIAVRASLASSMLSGLKKALNKATSPC